MIRPVRLRLSRAKGFNLQAISLALNGLPAAKVDRATPYGNPWRPMRFYEKWTLEERRQGLHFAYRPELFATQREAVEFSLELFRQMAEAYPHPLIALRDQNLACWCGLDDLCHADITLDLANRGSPP